LASRGQAEAPNEETRQCKTFKPPIPNLVTNCPSKRYTIATRYIGFKLIMATKYRKKKQASITALIYLELMLHLTRLKITQSIIG
jgi:hypothetical protein